MGIIFHVYIAFDDDTPPDKVPFSHEPGIWSMTDDDALSLCGERKLFAALGYDHDGQYAPPLIPLRGYPTFIADSCHAQRSLELQDYVGWLDSKELFKAIQHAGIDEKSLSKSVRIFLDVVRYFVSIYEEERVRVLYAFIP